MTTVRRLQAAAAISAAVFAATCWQIGDAMSRLRPVTALSRGITSASDRNAASLESSGIFASRPVITYATPTGSYFAWQLKPAFGETAARPRDLVVVIDISATKAGLPLRQARQLTEELTNRAGRDDRISIWTVNTPEETRDLTKGFRGPTDARVVDALTQLEKTIYAAGATDLKAGLQKVLGGLSLNDARRTAIVYLGDGNSVLNAMSDAERNRIAADMADRQVSMFTVPLGRNISAKTVHGFASATGGMVVRLADTDKVADIAGRMLKCIDAPVLYPTKAEFTNAVVEAMPTRLPPLRGDVPTLVAGRFRQSETVECRVEGHVNGKPVAMVIKEQLPETDGTNFFLMNLVKQWSDADRTAPAVMRADRGLALSFEQTRLARDEFLTQAHWALGMDKLDAAEHLFQSANAVDPLDGEAAAGAKIAQRLRSGEITKQQLAKEVLAMGGKVELVKAAATEMTQDASANRPGTEPASGAALLEQEKRRRAVQEQMLTQLVDDSVRQARQLVKTDPDSAYDLLKRQLGSVRDSGDLSDGVRSTLANRLESALRTIQADGARVKLEQEAALRQRIALEARKGAETVRMSEEERIRERVRLYGSLMDRARYEEAYKESLELQRELINKGRAIPPQVHAAYVMNTNAANIRDYDELRRVKEERFLLTMLQVDKSHVPFPDEPPVAFPPAAYWKEITDLRKDRYSSDGLGGFSRKAMELRDQLARPVSLTRSFDGIPLKDVLADFGDLYNITFLINPIPFKEAGDEKVEDKTVRIPKMPGVSLSTLLSYALSQINATYLVRKDYVEITTRKAAGYEKTVRTYPVADLVIPIPNAVDQQSLQQNLQVLGSSLSANGQAIFGSAGGGLNLGNFGNVGGGFQQFGGGFGGGIGGALGGGGGQAFLGGGGGQFQGGAIGAAGGTGQNNLGFGGGALGFGGGQQGQFGNLGGQFGIQGGDTSNILIRLIEDTIAPREWNTTAARYLQANAGQQPDDDLPPLDISLLNSMGYYQPSRALVVRGSARVHSRVGDFAAPAAAGGGGAANRIDRGGDVLVFGPKTKNLPGQPAVTKKPEPVKKDEPVVAKNVDRDPKKVWNDAMAQGHFKPRNVIAVGTVLTACAKFDEAAEMLKADLRHGILAHPCVFDALAIALQGSGASLEEIERAKLSKIDLDPKNPQNYLDVAASMNELGRQDKALEYCQRAASLEPNAPEAYHKALVMLGENANADAVHWATKNLLQRDWGMENALFHDQAKTAIKLVADKLDTAGQAAAAAQLRAIATNNRQRDLAIDAVWAEQADVDMTVAEPCGTVCASRTPCTPGGGFWTGDNLGKNEESYVAAQAFNGSYEVTVRRVWGRPLADKVSVRVTKHQGGHNESTELHTLVLDAKGEAKLKINMADGRREQLDSVPVAATVRRLPVTRQTPDEINNLLRSMADPMLAISRPGMTGGSSANGTMTENARANLPMEPGAELSHQTKVSPALSSGVDLLTKTTISGDRSTMKISFAPAFDAKTANPRVPLAAVPGGN